VTSAMRPLFAHWKEVAPLLSAHRTIALFLDFDGTLVPIGPRPNLVQVHPDTRTSLAILAHNPRFRVWVISARRRADIRARLRVPAVRCLGLYGWERASKTPPPARSISRVKACLEQILPPRPSVWIEDKQHTIAVHYRGAPEAIRLEVADCVRRAVLPWRAHLRVAPGKCVWEILPVSFADKGSAILRELAGLRGDALPVYVGDDLSDEQAFAVLPRAGVGIRVGARHATRARYSLRGSAEVRRFLERLRTEFP